MPVKTTNNAAKFVAGRKKAAAKFVFTAATLIKARAQQYVPIDTGALKNSSPVSKAEDNGSDVITSTISYLQDYASYLHDPKPGGKMDGWQPVLPEERAMRMSAANYPTSGVSGGYNPSATQGWIYIGAEEAKPSVDAAFKDLMGLNGASYDFRTYPKGDNA